MLAQLLLVGTPVACSPALELLLRCAPLLPVAACLQERKELIGKKLNEQHNNWGSLLLGLGVTISVAGGFNTFLRTGEGQGAAGYQVVSRWYRLGLLAKPFQDLFRESCLSAGFTCVLCHHISDMPRISHLPLLPIVPPCRPPVPWPPPVRWRRHHCAVGAGRIAGARHAEG